MERLDKKNLEDIVGLTPMQEGMLFHYLKDPENPGYFEQLKVNISGAVDLQQFKQAWNRVIEKNEMLRTLFRWEGVKDPVQITIKHYPLQLKYHDFSDRNNSKAEQAVETLTCSDRKERPRLDAIPFRITLCKIRNHQYVMIISYHHILYDGWSTGILLKEFYQAYNDWPAEPREADKGKFKDFVKWVRSRDMKKQERFWKNYLADFDSRTGISIRQIKSVESGEPKKYTLGLGKDFAEELETFVKARSVTAAAVMYSAWGILLQKYNHCGDVVFGTTVSGRSAPVKGIENIVGLFINTLPLRMRNDPQNFPGETREHLVSRVNENLKTREPYESTALTDIKEFSPVGGKGELFDSIVVMENYPLEVGKSKNKGEFSFDSCQTFEMTHYDLSLAILMAEDIQLGFYYLKGVFAGEAIARLANHFASIVRGITGQPGRQVDELEMISVEEKHQLLEVFNRSSSQYPKHQVVHRLVEEQVEQVPWKGAVEYRDCQLTYDAFNREINHWAQVLRSKGAGPGTIAAVLMSPSIELVVGIMAILKTGAAYLPINPSYPSRRIAFMLADSGANLLVTTSILGKEVEKLRSGQIETVFLEGIHEIPGSASQPLNLSTSQHLSPSRPAYVIYTSGSTGKPKGVVIEHAALINFLYAMYGYYNGQLGPGDHCLSLTNISFDVSVFEIFLPLVFGASLVLLPEEQLLEVNRLAKTLVDRRITLAYLPPGLLKEVFEQLYPWKARVVLDKLLVGVEPIKDEILENYFQLNPSIRVVNGYGPTESTVCSTRYLYESARSEGKIVPIGKPLANTVILLLDRFNRLAPVEVPGELCISGDGLARGYLNRPELTAERFFFVSYKSYRTYRTYNSKKIYKTGDLARWLPDGNIEFLGRVDHQVKIRGFRIEPGEVEHHLLRHNEITSALVAAGNNYLCAYFVSSRELGAPELREYLAAELPEHMIPSYFVRMEKMPLTENGKVDRRRLPEPEVVEVGTYIPPGNAVEKKLVELWSQVLGIPRSRIGIDSDFFELGGHSIKATRVVYLVQKELKVTLSIKAFFERFTTIRQMAQEISRARVEEFSEIAAVEEREYYPLSYAQKRLWIICQFEEESRAYNQVGAVAIDGRFNITAFEQAVQRLAERHESLRTVYITIKGEPKQKILNDFTFSLQQEDLSTLTHHRKEERKREIYSTAANKAFDLEKGPLFLFKLLRLSEEAFFLIFNMHHIINDGWSMGIITNEIFNFYNCFSRKEASSFGPLKFQYRDYTLWHNRLVEDGAFDAVGQYWLEKFKDKPNGIELPLDFPRQSIQTFNGGNVYFTIPGEMISRLQGLCRDKDATLFMGLLTLLDILLYKYTGQSDIILGSPVAGRRRPELQQMIGFLVNTLVFRNHLDPENSFSSLLEETRQETLSSYENQDYPFNRLVEQLVLDRDLSRSPLFNVMLAHNNTDIRDYRLKMAGVTVTDCSRLYDFNMSVFDLVFFTDETGDGISGSIMYNSDLFARPSIERMTENLVTLLESVLEHRDLPVYRLHCLSSVEYEAVTRDFNSTDSPFPQQTVQELVQQQVIKTPDKIAVHDNRNQLTYGELNRRANRLANYLMETCGAGPGSIIGICIDRSLELITGILGIIKSGAGYLSIDPTYPEDRIRHMLIDSGSSLLIVDKERSGSFDSFAGEILDIHSHWDVISRYCDRDPEVVNRPGDVVYVIYTSGSTGTPNGAMLSQGILSNLVQWQRQNTGIDSSGRCLQFTSVSFCVSFQEIMITLSSGGEVHLIGEIERQDIDYLMDFLSSRRIEILYLPFSYLNFLFNESGRWGRSFRYSLKHIITAGEQLIITTGLKRFLSLNPGIRLHNHYGSSEMHVVTSYTLDANTAARMPVPPAGKPVSNTKIYILDEWNRPVPVGAWGELHVTGNWDVLGYVNNPVLTRQKLLEYDLAPGNRHLLYRSGDVGRWLPDGNIQLKGRKDALVKVRGFRVDLQEIESKLFAMSEVKDCVAVVKEDGTQKYLAAYVVIEHTDVYKIKKYLSQYLPQHMIPRLVVLDRLPLLPNGKVDRDRLPEPEAPGAAPGTITLALEQQIIDLVYPLLGDGEDKQWTLSGITVDRIPPRAAAVLQQFEKHAAGTPDQTAVIGVEQFVGAQGAVPLNGNVHLTYKKLNQKSNQLARVIRKKGVQPDTAVALLIENPIEAAAAVLAVLKTGMTYLPLEPGLTPEQVTAQLKEHQVPLVITEPAVLKTHPFTRLQEIDPRSVKPHITAVRAQIKDFDRLPIPDRSLVDYEKYAPHIGLAMAGHTVTLQATRGCPFHCAYCHRIWHKGHVVRSAEHIFQELQLYYNMGVRRFVFVDDIFNLNIANSRRFFELIIKNGLKVQLYFPNGLRTDLLEPWYIDLMVEAGTVSLGLALETASPRLQKLINKNLDLDKLRENLHYLCEKHPRVILELFLMHGFPTETEEEARMTLDFLKDTRWIDFPYFHLLKIYPNTDMADIATANGIPAETIARSANLAFHELPGTLPFDKAFTQSLQAEFLNDYFLSKERLLAKLPQQMKVLTRDEIVEKYNSYLPVEIRSFSELLRFANIAAEELGGTAFPEEPTFAVPQLNEGLSRHFRAQPPAEDALRVLLLDLSQFFSSEKKKLYDGVEPPLGLLYLMTYLKHRLGSRVRGRVAKSRIDFDDYPQLKHLLEEFQPDVIGIRTLTYHGNFFHQTVSIIKGWGFDVPIIAGGPYATSDYLTVLQDTNVDLVVLGEGEQTFVEIVEKILENRKQLPGLEQLQGIPGIAFLDSKDKEAGIVGREMIVWEDEWASFLPLNSLPLDQVLAVLAGGGTLVIPSAETGPAAVSSLALFRQEEQTPPSYFIHVRLADHLQGLKRSAAGDVYAPPNGELQEKLVDLWGRVLEVEPERLSIDDNFFQLGGHSLTAAKVAARMHQDFNIKIPLADFFKMPTIREIAGYLEEQAGKFPKYKQQYGAVQAAEEREYYPLSSAQERLYILQQMEVDNINYNMPAVIGLEGRLDYQQLEKAFRKLIDRHESFRTSFEMLEGKPVQKVHNPDEVEFSIENYDPDAFVRAFDLVKAPLLRVGVCKLESTDHLLLVDMHHIISDGTSLGIWVKDFMTLIGDEALPPLPIRYRDFALWQKGIEKTYFQQETYWLEQLRGEQPVLELPLDYPRPVVQSFEGSTLRFEIGSEETTALNRLAEAEDVTLYMVLLALFTILLSKLSSQEDILVGTPVSGRRHVEVESIIGMFVNTLVMKNRVQDEMTFNHFLKEVGNRTLAAFDNQDYPFEHLVEQVVEERDAGRNPLFDVMVVFQDIEIPSLETPGLKSYPYPYESPVSKFDLTLHAHEENGTLVLAFEYCTRLFKESTIRRFGDYFRRLTAAVTRDGDTGIMDLEIIGEQEKQQLLRDFNRTDVDYPGDKTLQQLFEEQAARTPDGAAVVCVGRRAESVEQIVGAQGAVPPPTDHVSITYKELDKKSNQLAHLLIGKGVLADDIIGIMMERSVEMIIGILGILKAGGAYLPIDAEYPQERIDYMLKDSNASLLLTGLELLDDCKVDVCKGTACCAPTTLPATCNLHLSLAYVIYTSGTSGRPKGTMIGHRNVIRLMVNDKFQFDFNSSDVWTLFHSMCFDFSVWEMYGALLYGGKLVIVPRMIARDPGAFLNVLKEMGVTVLNQTPSAFYQLVEAEMKTRRRQLNLRYVIFGGEALNPARLKQWKETYPRTRLINMYGITETTVHVTYKEIEEMELRSAASNIGSPIPTLSTYVMDRNRKLQPVGAAGELVVGGEGTARGYLNQPELTAAKFLPVIYRDYRSYRSYRSYISKKIYKSGDRVRILENGDMEYLGRIDQQVKIRGFRIEPGEIETRLLAQPGVREAVVLARKDNEEQQAYLCAYIVTDLADPETGNFDPAALRENLTGVLPDYMVPSAFVRMDRIPLTINGKVDKKALPVPGSREAGETRYAAPGDAVEQKMAQLWQEVLNLDFIGSEDNFFAFGGHSLNATHLVHRIRETFQVEFPLSEIFVSPTVKAAAAFVKQAKPFIYEEIKPAPQMDYYPLSSAQTRLFFLDQLEHIGITYNVPALFRIEGTLDKERCQKAFERLLERHDILRTSFLWKDNEPVQHVHAAVPFAIEYHEVQDAAGTGFIDSFIRPFNLSQPPLLRVTFLETMEPTAFLLFDMHHIICDGISIEILVADFTYLYEYEYKNEGQRLTPLTLQYKDFVMWREHLQQKGKLKKQHDYWFSVFSTSSPVPRLELPTDYAYGYGIKRPEEFRFGGARYSFHLAEAELAPFRQLTLHSGVTLYMSLFAAFNVLLHKYSGQQDIVVGSLVMGRSHPALKTIIGMFVNALALRIRPKPNHTYLQLLEQVKTTCVKAFENQDLMWEELVKQVNPERDPSRNPLFDVGFLFQDQQVLKSQLEVTGARLIPCEYDTKAAKIDLALLGIESDDGVDFHLEYCTALFKPQTIQRMAGHFLNILRQAAAAPRSSLADIEILTPAERDRLLTDFNRTTPAEPVNKTIYQLFAEQTARRGDCVAVTDEHNMFITYNQLNQKASILARQLQEKGVQPDTIAALMMKRSIEMMAAVMGILKAGGAYLPIDPDYPQERIDYILKDSNAKVLVGEGSEVSKASEGIEVVTPGEVSIELPAHLIHTTHPTHLCYIIYTSGTTGKPKGVLIEQSHVVRLMMNREHPFDFHSGDVWTLFHSICFDFSVWEMYGALLYGGKLVIVSRMTAREPERFLNLLGAAGVTVLNQTPSAFYQLAAEALKQGIPRLNLRYVIFGGEALNPAKVKEWWEAYPRTRLINMFGITETTVHVTYKELTANDLQTPVSNIGGPIPTLSTYILGPDMKLLPGGVSGELFVGGQGVARGYLNQPRLTHAKFVSNPYNPGERLYRSGDRARVLEGRDMEYIGRIDQQVKIRGFRIEPAEIETHLLAQPGVREAVVLAREDRQNQQAYLCAYIVTTLHSYETENFSPAFLRENLAVVLPDYMIPSAFVRLERIPLTANGKVDKKALPVPGSKDAGEIRTTTPRDAVEHKMVQLWQDVLSVDTIGIDDDFFASGGHSLNATRLLHRIRQVFNVEFPLNILFQEPTIRAVSRYVRKARPSIYEDIRVVEKREFYPPSSAQKRLFFLEQFEHIGTSYNMPGVFKMDKEPDKERFETAIKQLIERHEALRTSFELLEDEPVQRIHENNTVAFKVEYHKSNESSAAGIIEAFVRPFDMSQAPLLRVELVSFQSGGCLLLFDMHHIIGDGTSMGILTNEFRLLYQGETLPPFKIQYKDFTAWQNHLFSSGAVDQQEAYWLEIFSQGSEIPRLDLPTDYPRPAVIDYEGSSYQFKLGAEETALFKTLTMESGATIYMSLLAAYYLLLHKYSGQEDIIVGSSIQGRPHADLQQIPGMFVNVLAMRNQPTGEKTFRQFLEEVKQNSINAFENQDLQFEALGERLNLKRDPSRHLLYDAGFALHNYEQPEMKFGEIRMTLYPYLNQTSKYDITLYVTELETEIRCDIEYAAQLFNHTTIEKMAEDYIEIIKQVIQNEHIKIEDIEMSISHDLLEPESAVPEMDFGF